VPYIPEPPPVPPDASLSASTNEVIEPVLNILGEPTLASMGLASWSPPGIVQQILEVMHIQGSPWWLTIVYLTALVRLLVFPLVINAQKNAAHMTNNMPQMQVRIVRFQSAFAGCVIISKPNSPSSSERCVNHGRIF
jgi:YidC/Oxa1 family membrane protein insertase